MIIFPVTYLILLFGSLVYAYRKEHKATKQKRAEAIKQDVKHPDEQDEPLPPCFSIEWDLQTGDAKIQADELD